MKIAGLNHQAVVNIGIIVVTAAIAIYLKEPLAILALMMIQPINPTATTESPEEYAAMIDAQQSARYEESEPAIGFHSNL